MRRSPRPFVINPSVRKIHLEAESSSSPVLASQRVQEKSLCNICGGQMKRDNFHCYRNILTIDPGYSFKNGAGYAIIDDETFRLKDCGVIRPFAPGLVSFLAAEEISDKLKKAWEEQVGFSYDPVMLYIEFPRFHNGANINNESLLMLSYMSGIIRRDFKIPINRVCFVRPNEWKGSQNKDQTEVAVLATLDTWSKKILERELSSLPKSLHHNVFDAIGLALWGLEKFKNNYQHN
jgi:hypothetical protein